MYIVFRDKKETNNYSVVVETQYSVLDKKVGLTFEEVKQFIHKTVPLTPNYIYNGWQELPYQFFRD